MYRQKDIDDITQNLSNIQKEAFKEFRSKNEPDIREISEVYLVIKNFIKKNNKIVYGGFAQNLLLQIKNNEDTFYNKIDEAYYNSGSIADLEFYSATPFEDLIYLTEELFLKKFKYVEGKEGMHPNTFKIYVNFENYCDISYMPRHMCNILPTIEIEGIRCIHPHYMLADYYRVITDPMTSYFRLDKSINRFQKLIKYYPFDLTNINNKIKLDNNDDNKLKYLRKKIIYNSKLIVIGFQAYNYYINKIDKKEKINVPYYEIISTQLNDDALMIYKKLLRKFKNVKVKQYIPFFEFFDNKIEYYVDDKLILVLYGNNERCIVYNYSEKKHCYFGTFNLVVMYILFNYFYAYINKFKEKKNIYYLLLIKLITYRNNYLEERNKTVLDDTPFKDFSLKCFGKSVELKRLSFLEGSRKKKQGQKPKEQYKPSGKIPKIVPKNYINISGNEISNEKYFIIKKNNI